MRLCNIFSFWLLVVPTISSCGGNPKPHLSSERPIKAQPLRLTTIPQTPPPPIAAESALVVCLDSGRYLYAKNADSIRAVASTQKIITALCVLDASNLDKKVVIQSYDTLCEPTKLYVKPGETYSRRELLKVLMIHSANDVARALARDVAGSVEEFAVLMNQKCASLGMRNSHFLNPHGLTETGQHSTARDMAIAAKAAYTNPILRSFVATKSYTFTFNDGKKRTFTNTNRLLKTIPYCNGMKTGTTNASGRCLISSGSLNERSVICVVLKSSTPHIWSDSEKLLRWALERPPAQ